MKIYTGSGDRGKTSLFSGERLPKAHDRIEAYGDVDELNSVMGAMVANLPDQAAHLRAELQKIQMDLLQVGAQLATTPASPSHDLIAEITDIHSRFLEQAIDRMHQQLPQLNHFVLPGGHSTAGWAHIARCVCRRAERHAVKATSTMEPAQNNAVEEVLIYLNRLSDYLFVFARYCNHLCGVEEIAWQGQNPALEI